MADETVQIKIHVDGATAVKTLQDLEKLVDKLNGKEVNIGASITGASGRALPQGLARAVQGAERSIEQGFIQGISSMSKVVGKAFIDAGNVSNWTSSFASGIGSAFSGMGAMFQFNALGTAKRYLTAMATRMVTGNIANVISRADILNTFTDYMTLAGVRSSTADTALARINQSILGLPIGLDEAAQRLRRYQMFMGDTEAATNMTIGIQNAIMAGGASEQMKTQAYYQIDRLLSAGKLSTSRQWLALLQGLGVSTRFLAREMGDAGMTAKEMAAGLTSGQISTDDFLKAVQRLATNKDVNKALDIYKNTYESWISNIRFAVTRGGANVLNALNDSLVSGTGLSNIDYMRLLRDSINSTYKGAANWLAENPQALSGAAGSFQGLFNAVGGIDFSRMASGTIGNIGRLVEYIGTAINRVSGGKLEDFISFATTLAAPIGGVMKAASGGLPAMLGIFDRFKDFNFEGLMDNITNAVGSMANLVSGGLGLIPDNTMSNLLAYGLVFGKPVGSMLGAIGKGIANPGNLLTWNSLLKVVAAGAFASYTSNLGQIDNLRESMFGGMPELSGYASLVAEADAASKNFANRTYIRQQQQMSTVEEFEAAVNEAAADRDAALTRREELFTRRAEANARYLAAQEELAKYQDPNMTTPAALKGFENEFAAASAEVKAAKEEIDGFNYSIKKNNKSVTEYYKELADLTQKLEDARKKQNALSDAIETGKWSSDSLTAYKASAQAAATTFFDTVSDVSKESSLGAFFAGTGAVELPDARYYNTQYGASSWRSSMGQTMESERLLASEYQTIEDFFLPPPEGVTDKQMKQAAMMVQDYLSRGNEGLADLRGIARRLGIGSEREITEFLEDADTWARQSQLLTTVENTATALYGLTDAWTTGGQALVNYTHAAEQFQPIAQETINTLNQAWQNGGGSKKDLVDAVFGGTSATGGGGLSDRQSSAFDELTGMVHKLKETIEEVPAAMEGVGEELSGAVETASMSFDTFKDKVSANSDAAAKAFGAAGKKIAEDANKATGAIDGIADSLNGIHDVNASINITGSVNLPQLPPGLTWDMLLNGGLSFDTGSSGSSSSSSSHKSTTGGWKPNSALQMWSRGGVVYAANGMFIPHGTDTVPAMLTPGEYVVRRKAAAAFGKAFMDRVNALDIHGAFRALSHRMNVPSTGSFIANNQRTYDNHASVTQNIVTNSQSFTHRRARRWVRALT